MEVGSQSERGKCCEHTWSALDGSDRPYYPYFPQGKLIWESQGNAVMVRQAEQSSLISKLHLPDVNLLSQPQGHHTPLSITAITSRAKITQQVAYG